ncbi:hypothetical protein [Chryseobacterium defluvii]|nr:hypothetical protein [Chryseobacterium defluvii]
MNAQVGINTDTPEATFDITAKNPTGTSTDVDGLLLPRVDRQKAQSMTGVPVSTLIYVNSIATGTQTGTAANIDSAGYYYFNGSAWIKLNINNLNIYNSNGTLTANRVVTTAGNSLSFTNGANNILIGTTGTQGIITATGSTRGALQLNGGSGQINAFVDNNNAAQINSTGNSTELNIGTLTATPVNILTNGSNKVTITSAGQVGVGTSAPSELLDINGRARVRTMDMATGSNFITPVYSDSNGVLIKASSSAVYGGIISSSSTIASGATGALITGMAAGAVYKAIVTVGDGCSYITVAEYMVTNYSFNNNYAIKGLDGLFSNGSAKAPTFTETNRTTTGTTWAGKPTCADGGNSSSLNYTLTMPSAGTINVTNNGNVGRTYNIVLTRII